MGGTFLCGWWKEDKWGFERDWGDVKCLGNSLLEEIHSGRIRQGMV